MVSKKVMSTPEIFEDQNYVNILLYKSHSTVLTVTMPGIIEATDMHSSGKNQAPRIHKGF